VTPPSSLEALIESLGNDALNGEISWQAADRALTLAEQSAERLETERERREWLIYAERIRQSTPQQFTDQELWHEVNWARYYWLEGHEVPWLQAWQQSLQEEASRRQKTEPHEPAA